MHHGQIQLALCARCCHHRRMVFTGMAVPALQKKQLRTWNTWLLSRVSRWAGFGFRCATLKRKNLFNRLHAIAAAIQGSLPPHCHLVVWTAPYYCCSLLECSWLSLQKLGFKLLHYAETELNCSILWELLLQTFFEQIALQKQCSVSIRGF